MNYVEISTTLVRTVVPPWLLWLLQSQCLDTASFKMSVFFGHSIRWPTNKVSTKSAPLAAPHPRQSDVVALATPTDESSLFRCNAVCSEAGESSVEVISTRRVLENKINFWWRRMELCGARLWSIRRLASLLLQLINETPPRAFLDGWFEPDGAKT